MMQLSIQQMWGKDKRNSANSIIANGNHESRHYNDTVGTRSNIIVIIVVATLVVAILY